MGSNGISGAKGSLNGGESQNHVLNGDTGEDDESQQLLPCIRGELSKKSTKPGRKVQWNDKNGKQLAEVLEFQPSDASESDDEESESCFCTIM